MGCSPCQAPPYPRVTAPPTSASRGRASRSCCVHGSLFFCCQGSSPSPARSEFTGRRSPSASGGLPCSHQLVAPGSPNGAPQPLAGAYASRRGSTGPTANADTPTTPGRSSRLGDGGALFPRSRAPCRWAGGGSSTMPSTVNPFESNVYFPSVFTSRLRCPSARTCNAFTTARAFASRSSSSSALPNSSSCLIGSTTRGGPCPSRSCGPSGGTGLHSSHQMVGFAKHFSQYRRRHVVHRGPRGIDAQHLPQRVTISEPSPHSTHP